MKVCVPGWHRLTSRMKTSSSLKRFCPAATLFDQILVLIRETSISASTGALFYWLNLTSSVSSDVARIWTFGRGSCRRHRRLAPIPRGGGAREFQLLHPGSADRGERPLVGFAADAARREPPTSPVPVGGIVFGSTCHCAQWHRLRPCCCDMG